MYQNYVGVFWLLLIILATSVGEEGKTYYCSPDESLVSIGNVTTGKVHTVYDGETYYGNNRYCHWLIDSGDNDTHIQVTVTQSDIQWAPENAICNGYDFMQMFDGPDEESLSLVSFCGIQNPRSVTSSGRYMYITFKSNDRNPYKYQGIKLDVKMFDTTATCPPGWATHTAPGEGEAWCYAVKQHQETWGEAQQYCNTDQSNLVSLRDDAEADFVTDLVKDAIDKEEYAWIGLNDIYQDNRYVWIDGIESTVTYRWQVVPHESNVYWNCVVIRGRDALWEEQFCTESEVQTLVKRKFVCKARRDGNTELYNVPPERPKDNRLKPNMKAVFIVIGVVLGGGLILSVIIVMVIRAKKQRNATAYTAENTENIRMNQQRGGNEQGQRRGSTNSQPPTYEEAVASNK